MTGLIQPYVLAAGGGGDLFPLIVFAVIIIGRVVKFFVERGGGAPREGTPPPPPTSIGENDPSAQIRRFLEDLRRQATGDGPAAAPPPVPPRAAPPPMPSTAAPRVAPPPVPPRVAPSPNRPHPRAAARPQVSQRQEHRESHAPGQYRVRSTTPTQPTHHPAVHRAPAAAWNGDAPETEPTVQSRRPAEHKLGRAALAAQDVAERALENLKRPAVGRASAPTVNRARQRLMPLLTTSGAIRDAMLLREILSPPLALRDPAPQQGAGS